MFFARRAFEIIERFRMDFEIRYDSQLKKNLIEKLDGSQLNKLDNDNT